MHRWILTVALLAAAGCGSGAAKMSEEPSADGVPARQTQPPVSVIQGSGEVNEIEDRPSETTDAQPENDLGIDDHCSLRRLAGSSEGLVRGEPVSPIPVDRIGGWPIIEFRITEVLINGIGSLAKGETIRIGVFLAPLDQDPALITDLKGSEYYDALASPDALVSLRYGYADPSDPTLPLPYAIIAFEREGVAHFAPEPQLCGSGTLWSDFAKSVQRSPDLSLYLDLSLGYLDASDGCLVGTDPCPELVENAERLSFPVPVKDEVSWWNTPPDTRSLDLRYVPSDAREMLVLIGVHPVIDRSAPAGVIKFRCSLGQSMDRHAGRA